MKRLVPLVVAALVVALLAAWVLISAPRARPDAALDALSPAPAAVVSTGQRTVAVGAGEATPFLIGSLSKAFTAIAVMQQVERGRIVLDRPLGDWRPQALRAVTPRQLLHHTSGLTRNAGLRLADRTESGPAALTDLVNEVTADDLGNRRGTYQYSDANYLVLGALVQDVTGVPFGVYIETEVFAPLGMSRSTATPRGAAASGVGAGHRIVFGAARTYSRPYPETGAPYGYMVSTAGDLARFGRWMLDPQSLDGVLGVEHARQLTADGPAIDGGRRYAMGWRVGPLDGDGPTVIEHTGATPGFFAHVLLLPESGDVVVVLADAYSEARATTFTQVGWNLARDLAGYPDRPAARNWLLLAAPWLLLAAAVAAWTALAMSLARRRRRHTRFRALGAVAAIAVAVAVAVLAGALPALLGTGWREVLIWAPDIGWTAIALGAAAVTVVVAVLTAAVRSVTRRTLARRAPRGPSSGPPSPDPPATPQAIGGHHEGDTQSGLRA
ncbi:hypothetical protein GCM10009624_03700 [Gordonia sinesedis]